MVCDKPHNLLMEVLREVMNAYCEKHDIIFDYLWICYFIDACYDHIPSIRQMIDEVPYSNPHVFSIDWASEYRDGDDLCFYDDTFIYKTSAKTFAQIPEISPHGKKTMKWYFLHAPKRT